MQDLDEDVLAKGRKLTNEQRGLIGLSVATPLASLLYHVLFHVRLGHSAVLFLGLPAVLACLLTLAPRSVTVTGGILKGITFFLLVVAPLLGEGALCIVIAAPLFYLVGLIIGSLADWQRRRAGRGTTLSCMLLLLAPMCLEGSRPGLSFSRAETVQTSRVVAATPDQVAAALAAPPDVRTPLPLLLRMGFPRPLSAASGGLAPGATRQVGFSGAEGAPPGVLTLEVTSRQPGSVRFTAVSDTTKLDQWLRWRDSEIEWHAVDAAHTRITARIHFDRGLDPAWYFAPLERGAVRLALRFLLEANLQSASGAAA